MWFRGSILAAAGILVRIIGMLYRMPLNDIIGKQGNGYYTSAYNVYNILLILSSYSMPVAVSKMISSRLARGEYHNCRRILKAGLVYATAAGGIAAAVLWFGADLFAELIKTPMSRYALKTLAPTIWIMAYLGVLRGYFQGMGTMVPTALSQILEQIVNAVVSVVAAGLLFQRGLAMNAASGAEDYSYALGAAGGTIGTGAGALTALLFFYPSDCFRGKQGAGLCEAQESRDQAGNRTAQEGELWTAYVSSHHHGASHRHQQRRLQLLQCGGQLFVWPGDGQAGVRGRRHCHFLGGLWDSTSFSLIYRWRCPMLCLPR